MVLGSNLVTVQDYRSQMADLIPTSNIFQKNYSNDIQKCFDGLALNRRDEFKQPQTEQEHSLKRHNASISRRPYIPRCSSLEAYTARANEFTPSLPLSSESQKPPKVRYFAQTNGYPQERLTSRDDSAQISGNLNHNFQITHRSPSWPTFSNPHPGCCSKFPEERNLLRGAQIVSPPTNRSSLTPNYDCSSEPGQRQTKTFITEDFRQKKETHKNMKLFTSNCLQPTEISFSAWSPIANNPSPFNYSVDNTSRFTFRSTSSNMSELSKEFSGNSSSTTPAGAQQCCTNKLSKSRVSSLKLASQSYSDISKAKTRQSLQLSKSSSGDFIYQSMNSKHANGFYLTDAPHASLSASNLYSTLPRRCNSDHFLRRTLSQDARIQEIKSTGSITSSQNEIESEYVTLDKRYAPPNYTRLYEVTEGVAFVQNPHFNVRNPPSSNGNPSQGDDIHNIVADKPPFNINAISAFTDNPNASTLKSYTLSDSKNVTSKHKNSTGSFRTMAETIGSLFSYKTFSNSSRSSPRTVRSVAGVTGSIQGIPVVSSRRRSSGDKHEGSWAITRSRSLSDLHAVVTGSDESKRNYSDDEDGDEFGFLSYPISFISSSTSAAMNKTKSPSPGSKNFTKRWRNKTTAVSAVSNSVAMWTPGPPGSHTWSSVSGRKVQLRPVSILNLTDTERIVLQNVALSKLQSMDIGCTISIPKDTGELPRAKKSPLTLKRRSKSVSASALDTMVKDGTSLGLAFGIPLLRCILNDRQLDKRTTAASLGDSLSSVKVRTHSSDNLLVFRSDRKSSSSSQGSTDNSSSATPQRLESLTVPLKKRTASSDSLSESESSNNTNSSLIDALSLSTSNPHSSRPSSLVIDSGQLVSSGQAQVPYVVRSCFKHIETYGLQTLGIFRVGSSKKRVKQLREEFDCGREVKLTDEHNPHDVGALLKEFFRDLPEPLLTRELYLPFLHAERIKDEQKRHSAIGLLICMLPVPNRDTLWALLRFLAVVSHHAADVTNEKGEIVAGNKMDSHNLATLFGPNILHRTKVASEKELISESVERVEQSKEVIEVVKDMIDNYHELFQISASLRDDVLRLLIESNQEVVNRILRHLANQNQIETDPESMCSVFEDSCNSPVLYHSTLSDVDLTVFARRQTATSHRPLRVTKSADDSLDSPASDLLDPRFPETETMSFTPRNSLKTVPLNTTPVLPNRSDSGHSYPSPVSNKVPVVKTSYEPTISEVVLRNRLETVICERPYSEGFSRSLNIPRQFYHRQNSSSSVSSGLPSPLISYSGSDNGQCGQWILPTPPTSRASSPKHLYRCSSSSSAVIPTSTASHLNISESSSENSIPFGSSEWERERWKHWEKMAAQKKTVETEQETLV